MMLKTIHRMKNYYTDTGAFSQFVERGSKNYQRARAIRNGSKIKAVMNLKIRPIVSPSIIKGRRTSHKTGRKKSTSNAMGQQVTNKRHHRIRIIEVFTMNMISYPYTNIRPVC